MMQIREQGWECPSCQRVWAPKIAACGACNTEIDRLPPRTIPRFIDGLAAPTDFKPHWTPPTNNAPRWNYTADDQSYADRWPQDSFFSIWNQPSSISE